MIIINGKVFSGNVKIVNGKIISQGDSDNLANKKFDETKKESASGVNRININSDVDVKLSACNTDVITAHFYGEAITDDSPSLSVTRNGSEIDVSLNAGCIFSKNTNISVSGRSSVIISNTGHVGMTLDVRIPAKVYEKLFIQSKNGNVDVASSVNANTIILDSYNGDIDLTAGFRSLIVKSHNGNIDVKSKAQNNVDLNINNYNGNIDIALTNLCKSTVSAHSTNGDCRNAPKLRGQYMASGNITSYNGDISFR